MKRVFSGIKATGQLHLGNYLGALSQWVQHQDEYENYFCIVDLHSITTPINPDELRKNSLQIAAWYVAAGIDPQKSVIFLQSHNPDHAQLAWILNCVTSMGQLNRMTQYKDKKEKVTFVSAGLFDYPVLMAADILLYHADLVPVGDDQKQHIELTRDIAERFNSQYGKTFTIPEYMAPPVGARVMSLQDPSRKMSKSEDDPMGTIDLINSADEIKKKIASATTDNGNEIKIDESKPGISNLITIYKAMCEISDQELDEKYSGKGYKVFKEDLTEIIIETLTPLQIKYKEVLESNRLEKILSEGVKKAHAISEKTLGDSFKRIGLK